MFAWIWLKCKPSVLISTYSPTFLQTIRATTDIQVREWLHRTVHQRYMGGGGSLSVNLSENNWAQTEVDNLQIHLSYNRNHMTDHSLSQKKSYEFREIYFLSISEQTYLSRSWSKIYTSTVNVNLRVTNQKKRNKEHSTKISWFLPLQESFSEPNRC